MLRRVRCSYGETTTIQESEKDYVYYDEKYSIDIQLQITEMSRTLNKKSKIL